ncbi:transcriptional regulator, AraC family [Mesonia phycicola]|uniref:Transcriptional regulator, AraC family n=1 Tax=Mesonia phycicola TaxID=579105 RepID=A0A1M6DJH2_9FLAO|nr:helix-turn-helix domain-containing protein [Mesonia phycicola]SHI73281.1 transcriptional regulator, AraC family [Mesonia phycicola]
MQVFNINHLKVKDILYELSNYMQTSVKENFTEYTLEIPEQFGTGSINGVNFPNGVGMLSFKGMFKHNVAIYFKSKETHPLKFIYIVKGKLTHAVKPDAERKSLKELQSAIISSPKDAGHIYKFKENEEFFFQSVEIDRKIFQSHFNYKLEKLPLYFYKIFADVEGKNEMFYTSNYSLQISEIIRDIERFSKNGFIRINYIGAKSLEILAAMLSQYEDDIKNNSDPKILRKRDVNVINEIANYIQHNYSEFKNIDELANKFGINNGKIQQGFQLQFQQSVNEYLNNVRLNKAIELLNEGEKNISEIVYALGLSSRSYFSKIFKERFKILPSEYIKNKS